MLKKRLIPVLLLQNGLLVRSEKFSIHQIIGNPINEVERFNQWNVDELIYLDITQNDFYDSGRDDAKIKNLTNSLEILDEVSKNCMMPLTWGGRIRKLEDIYSRMKRGADKVSINTIAFEDKSFIRSAAKEFGNQAIVVNIDVKKSDDNEYSVMINSGKTCTNLNPIDWAKKVEDMGAGEILLQSIDRDGLGIGYDIEIINKISNSVSIPVICLGGVGNFKHYASGIKAGASAVAAANLWHFKEMADRLGKQALKKEGIHVRQ